MGGSALKRSDEDSDASRAPDDLETIGGVMRHLVHDINNALTVIHASTDALLEAPVEGAVQEYALEIREAAAHVASIARELALASEERASLDRGRPSARRG